MKLAGKKAIVTGANRSIMGGYDMKEKHMSKQMVPSKKSHLMICSLNLVKRSF